MLYELLTATLSLRPMTIRLSTTRLNVHRLLLANTAHSATGDYSVFSVLPTSRGAAAVPRRARLSYYSIIAVTWLRLCLVSLCGRCTSSRAQPPDGGTLGGIREPPHQRYWCRSASTGFTQPTHEYFPPQIPAQIHLVPGANKYRDRVIININTNKYLHFRS